MTREVRHALLNQVHTISMAMQLLSMRSNRDDDKKLAARVIRAVDAIKEIIDNERCES